MQSYFVGIRPRSAEGRRGASMEYYHWRDLGIGKTVQIFGREMLLTDADDFTRRFYRDNGGADDGDMQPIPVRGPGVEM